MKVRKYQNVLSVDDLEGIIEMYQQIVVMLTRRILIHQPFNVEILELQVSSVEVEI